MSKTKASNGNGSTSSPSLDRQIAMELFFLIERSCGHSELVDDIAVVMEHWGNGQTSEQVLAYLKDINRNGLIFRKVFASKIAQRT